MADKNICDPNAPPQEEIQPGSDNKNTFNLRIVGLNLITLAVYTFVCALFREAGFLLDSLLLLIHVSTCFIIAIAGNRIWALSGLAVLLIGFSTCVGILWRLA